MSPLNGSEGTQAAGAPSAAVLTNQYRVHPDTELRVTEYSASQPHLLAGRWRAAGWDAVEHQGAVRVYHSSTAPRPLAEALHSVHLPLSPDPEATRALNATLRRALTQRGYVPRGDGKYTRFEQVEPAGGMPQVKGVRLLKCQTWTWSAEFIAGTCWLTPRPTWTKITEGSIEAVAWRLASKDPERLWTIVNTQTGRVWTRQRLTEEALGADVRNQYCHLIYKPKNGDEPGSLDVDDIHQAITAEPAFAEFADITAPRKVDALEIIAPGPAPLRIRKKIVGARKDIIQLGVHKKPHCGVLMVAVTPAEDRAVRQHLRALFSSPTGVKQSGSDLLTTNVHHVWHTKLKLRASPLKWFSGHVYYDPATGQLLNPELMDRAQALAEHSGQTLVTVAALPKKRIPQAAMAALREAVRPFNHCFVSSEAYSIKNGPQCWAVVVRLTLKLLRAAGGEPYELASMPGAESGTYFLGLDVGSHHAENRSNLGAVLVDHRGRVVAKRVFALPENNERIPAEVLTEAVPQWLNSLSQVVGYDRLRRVGPISVSHLVVHRDGRFLPGEAADLRTGLTALKRIELVEIKKNSALRMQACDPQDRLLILDAHTAIVFSQAALEGHIRPLEVHCLETGQIQTAATQVLWLSEMRTDEVYRPGRLPVTTFLADRLASTTH